MLSVSVSDHIQLTPNLPQACEEVPQISTSLTMLIGGLFFCSGAFSLIYEVGWLRLLTLEFGSTTLAMSTILTIFMGGLALGSWLMGRWIDRSPTPLTWFGILECSLGIYALLTPFLFQLVYPLVGIAGSTFGDSIWPISLVRFLVAAVLLLPPTMLMGATLPCLTRFYENFNKDGERAAGLLYGVNTTGGFVGTLVVGFVLLPQMGLSWTISHVAGCNLILGILAFLIGRRMEDSSVRIQGPSSPLTIAKKQPGSIHTHSIMAAIACTAFAAMICEVAWTRVLALVLGGSVYVFTIVLATFLAGLGFGALGVSAVLRFVPSRARAVFYGMAILAAILVSVSAAIFPYLPDLIFKLYGYFTALGGNVEGVFQAQFLVAAIVMLVPAVMMGGLFPAAIRVMGESPHLIGEKVGSLYAWNTVGSILGAFTGGFLLIPFFGIRGALIGAVVAQCIGASVSVLGAERTYQRTLIGMAGAVLLFTVVLMPAWNHQLMTSAPYADALRYQRQDVEPSPFEKSFAQQKELLYYRDGLSATVTVSGTIGTHNHRSIATNGKVDGSSGSDMATQQLLAHLPLLLHPDPEEICVIGMGTGVTAGSAALHPVNRVTVVEIESAMVEGAKFFKLENHDIHNNPNVDIRVTDGRLFLGLHPQKFDVVISEPSNPWMAGSSDLFTVEFFQLGAKALRNGGFFAQWVPIYGMSPETLQTVVRTFAHVFPYVYLGSTSLNSDIVLLGSQKPFALDLEQAKRRMDQPKIQEDLAHPRVGIHSLYDLIARIRLGPDDVRRLMGSGPLHTDDHPIIAYNAPKDFYKATRRQNMFLLAAHARGISPFVQHVFDSAQKKRQFFQRLASAYRAYLPGGREAKVADELGLL